MVWIKNCQDDDWINLDNVFSISFEQMDAAGKDDWIEFIVRPSGARIFQICLDVGINPNPDSDSDNISWHSLFYDRAMQVTTSIFETISKAKKEDKILIDLQQEIVMNFKIARKEDKDKI